MLAPPLKLLGGGPGPPAPLLPTPMTFSESGKDKAAKGKGNIKMFRSKCCYWQVGLFVGFMFILLYDGDIYLGQF